MQGVAIDAAALKAAAVPLGGVLGAVAAGWLSDRFFAGRRAPVVALMLAALASLTALSGTILRSGSAPAHFVMFGIAGFLIYGPQVMVVGTLPQDFASRAVVAGAAGFINSMGYLGAWIGDVVTGRLAHAHGWEAALSFWSATALAAALLVATQWRARPADALRPGAPRQ
jgi:sugar phosphate permease